MIFNFSASKQILFISVFAFVGCGDFLKGKPKQAQNVEINSKEMLCLKDFKGYFQKILDSKATKTEIDESFSCVNRALAQFQQKAEGGTNPNVFTTDEIYKIFDKLFKDAELSRESTQDLILLKRGLIGGSADAITKAELEQVRSIISAVGEEIKELAPFMKVYSLNKENGPFKIETIDTAYAKLKVSIVRLYKLTKLSRSDYEFSDFKELIINLKLLKDDQMQLLNLAEAVKNLLCGKDALKTNEEMLDGIDNFIDLMALYSRALYTELKFEISTPEKLNAVVDFTENILAIVEKSVQFKKNKAIPVQFIDPITEEIMKKKILPINMDKDLFNSFYKTMVIRVFGDQKNLSDQGIDSLKEIHFKNLRREILIFKLYLDFINSLDLKTEEERLPVSVIQKRITSYNTKKTNPLLANLDEAMLKTVVQGFDELRKEFQSSRPVLYRYKKMVMAENQNIWDQNWEDLVRGLYGRMLARELILGWGNVDQGFDLYKSFVSEDGLVKWYSDFRSFGIAIKLFDPRTQNNGKRSMTEANLMTYSGTGDDKLDYMEAMQYVNMLFSNGGEVTSQIREVMKTAGCNLKALDAFGNYWIDEKCFIKNLRKNYKYIFSNTSYFVGYLDLLKDDKQFESYYSALMSVARNDEKIQGQLETADIRVFAMLAMYIESIYARFDTDKNWQLNPQEIRDSYPRFAKFATDFANKNAKETLDQWDAIYNICKYSYTKDQLIREAFIFMVYNGRMPSMDDLNYVTCKRNGLFTFTGEVDRTTIINTFKVLKSVLASP